MNCKSYFLKFLILLVVSFGFSQQGGMWIPSLLEGFNEVEMKNLGAKISAKDIFDANKNSIKDAIVHFGGGCTSEIISPKGLLLTNHHCGYRQIQSHSSVENDYLKDGFWAMSMDEELSNPGLTATIIINIEDVTSQVLKNTSDETDLAKKELIIQKNIQETINNYPKKAWQNCQVKSFYHGNQYLLFLVETFKDVRLVGAPPSSIGKFGSDTDNWMWPRHTGDFALFRIYANKDNQPAEYSKDNIPYQPKHYLPVATYGIQENDFTLVYGFPGRTQEYLPAVAVEQIVNVLNPSKIKIRATALEIQDKMMRENQAIKIKYASKYASVANYWKKWIGENQGLNKSNAVAIKKQIETKFLDAVNKNNDTEIYGAIFSNFQDLYQKIESYALARDYFMEVVMRNCEFLNHGYRLYLLDKLIDEKGIQQYESRKTNQITVFDNLFKNFDKKVDQKVFDALIKLYIQQSPQEFLPQTVKDNLVSYDASFYENSILHSHEAITELLKMNATEFQKTLHNDQGYLLVKHLTDAFDTNVKPHYESINRDIEALQSLYMKGIMTYSTKEDRIFPDANSTLRVTYGKVKGYSPSDAITYHYMTYLDGVIEKYQPGDYEFDVPQKLLDLYQNKDYGKYSDNGKMPVCFVATNHTTGGNSGSPAIDAYGNLIGLNFDRVWEGTMSDIFYDPDICRNIMVDARYILFIVDKFANAKYLVDEMTLVTCRPKRKSRKKDNKNK